jgi:hypothetical protein
MFEESASRIDGIVLNLIAEFELFIVGWKANIEPLTQTLLITLYVAE